MQVSAGGSADPCAGKDSKSLPVGRLGSSRIVFGCSVRAI